MTVVRRWRWSGCTAGQDPPYSDPDNALVSPDADVVVRVPVAVADDPMAVAEAEDEMEGAPFKVVWPIWLLYHISLRSAQG